MSGHNVSYTIAFAPSEDFDQPAKADQRFRCPLKEPWLPVEWPSNTYQTAQMRMLILVFAGRTCMIFRKCCTPTYML